MSTTGAHQILSRLLRDGTRRLINRAAAAEVQDWIEAHAGVVDSEGRRVVVRNGYLPVRSILTIVGVVDVLAPRVLDRRQRPPLLELHCPAPKFVSRLIPPYTRRTNGFTSKSLGMYLDAIHRVDVVQALHALIGRDMSAMLSESAWAGLREYWAELVAEFLPDRLAGPACAWLWPHASKFQPDPTCPGDTLSLLCASSSGQAFIAGMTSGDRRNKDSWAALLQSCQRRGLHVERNAVMMESNAPFAAALCRVFPAAAANCRLPVTNSLVLAPPIGRRSNSMVAESAG